MKQQLKRLQLHLDKYQQYLMPAMLFGGMLLDFFTFKTLKTETAFSILLMYLALATVLIIYTQYYKANKRMQGKLFAYLYAFTPFALQFFFGALLSASFVFYWFSGSFSVSWPLMLLLIGLIIGNEKVRNYYLTSVVQFGVYYFSLFSILSVMFPFWLNSLSAWVFILSGLVSTAWMSVLLLVLSKRFHHLTAQYLRIRNLCLGIFVLFNLFYFTNIIPPIPLSIRHAGVYHNVSRSGAEYLLLQEKTTLLEKILPGVIIEKRRDASLYLFSSIFAPADLTTRIVHDWQYFDEEQGRWVSQVQASYRLSGGRQDGYRGFSLSNANREGRWRVDIETERGQVLGRVKFRVKFVQETPETVVQVN